MVELARKFHDNVVRSLPQERAAEIAARTLALPDDETHLMCSRSGVRASREKCSRNRVHPRVL